MSPSYPPAPPRRLERSRTNKVVAGVCGGVAEYLNMDPTLVRILTVVITLFTGVPIIAYLVALVIMPEAPAGPVPPASVDGPQAGYAPYSPESFRPGATPGPAPQPPVDEVWGPAGAPWEQRTGAPNRPSAGAVPPQPSAGAEGASGSTESTPSRSDRPEDPR